MLSCHLGVEMEVSPYTEEKERHNKIVEEVLRRIEENDLDVKPEKYIWKVREIDFLGLVMGSGGIKIQEEIGVLE